LTRDSLLSTRVVMRIASLCRPDEGTRRTGRLQSMVREVVDEGDEGDRVSAVRTVKRITGWSRWSRSGHSTGVNVVTLQ
jgi:hypothetical protein